MTDPDQIPNLIHLLDDESLDVRLAVAKELAAFGPTLRQQLRGIRKPLNDTQKEYIERIFEGQKRAWLRRTWPVWLKQFDLHAQHRNDYWLLEKCLTIISEFLNRIDYDFQLGWLLDELAAEYQVRFKESDPALLAKFLFKIKNISGDESDYYNPQNSNLVYVIKERKGVPISLTSLYMLVGKRLGIMIEGCHFPGHFLAKIPYKGRKVFVDCFNGGHIIEERDLLNIKQEAFKGLKKVLRERADVQMVIRALLANLIRAYQIKEDVQSRELLIKLFNDMDTHLHGKRATDLTPEDIIEYEMPAFDSGQRVHHKRYGYRGIIVEVDEDCMATDEWYYGNQTQPSRNQPWYHVLVHGSDQVTYVAENNLEADATNLNVIHPLMSYFFSKTKEGDYIRNDNAWPDTDF